MWCLWFGFGWLVSEVSYVSDGVVEKEGDGVEVCLDVFGVGYLFEVLSGKGEVLLGFSYLFD